MPALSIVLAREADKDEIHIYQYITETFGEVYANKFRGKLIDLFHTLANQPFIGRPAKNDT
ncbi:MAG: type II toxin-antitoxin system RelE/ParE family toxin [Ginsengibacter sp.]